MAYQKREDCSFHTFMIHLLLSKKCGIVLSKTKTWGIKSKMSHPLIFLSGELNFLGRLFLCPLTVNGNILTWSNAGLFLPIALVGLLAMIGGFYWLVINPRIFQAMLKVFLASRTDSLVFVGSIGLNSALTSVLAYIVHKSRHSFMDLYQDFQKLEPTSTVDYQKVCRKEIVYVHTWCNLLGASYIKCS